MVSLSSFAKLGAAARNAMTSREAQNTAQNLETINKAVQKLIATVKSYEGGLLAANAISGDEAALGVDIKNATTDTKKSEVVSDAEATELIAYISNTLEASIAEAMQALKDKKEKLAAAGLQGTVLGDLNDLRKETATLSNALVEKAPLSKQEEAKAANKRVDDRFEDAIKFFS